ncbi:double-strand break repair protein AddB [Commensalibacter papalotli (ex Servin-Garciduenas et al. 2014)]|uniref:Nuclease n=1 Tax=Commensalibacter papalotli (ex Servin-Garciduenas et al. 2014) TaxID=1208583 RepID=W7DTU3_9PROT|nr:double-strand break repair protein AddB [Commensalibacter papalotli (ex Servin-Garciduenas et al. 2014)]EUK17683.1 nuclease [Commensalibacter papalotli (ex Servin-Garciduenas et al. 2014)]
MNLVSIPFNMPFLEILAKRWMTEVQNQPDMIRQGIILVPNQRTVKALIDTFLRITKGKPILLPRIMSIGAIDESALILKGEHVFSLPPAVDPILRTSLLTKLIMRMDQSLEHKEQAGEIWKLACSLAELMDEAEWADCSLHEALPKAVDGEYAEHWQNILKFLTIITDIWPQWLLDNQVMNPIARKVALLRIQAHYWQELGSNEPVWAVGFIDARPAVVELLSSIMQMSKGKLIVTGIQEDLPEDIWSDLSLTHPYAEMAKMFTALGVKRFDFQIWQDEETRLVPFERVKAFQQTLLPAELLDQWLADQDTVSLPNCYLSEPRDQQQEAVSIALIIRDALKQPEKIVALVTPDRNLAMRVALELGRWGIVADDSAGEPLYKTPAAILLSLLTRACIEKFTPVSLLSLLKHPFVCCGYVHKTCREYTRLLEVNILRQFAASGLETIGYATRQRIAELELSHPEYLGEQSTQFLAHASEILNLIHLLERFMAPLLEGAYKRSADQWAIALVEVAEALTSNVEQAGEELLWTAEEGNALAEHLRNIIAEAQILADITLQEFEGILNASYTGMIVHTRRVLRGRKDKELHPRVYIWGLIEARLQVVDMVILGGLSEGVWPPVIDSGPWISRPMRTKMGIPLPDAEVGRSAYDFMLLCCSVPEIVLSVPLQRDNAPVVPSRWITRLKAWLKGRDGVIVEHPALSWAKLLDQPKGAANPIAPPRPTPPLVWRPKSISITDVEYWLKDPYEIYAKRILKLRKIVGLEEDRSASIFGNVVHDGLKRAYQQIGWDEGKVQECMIQALEERRDIIPSMREWWRSRVLKIAQWVYAQEQERRNQKNFGCVYSEISGSYDFSEETGIAFTLRGIADRIDLNYDGTIEIFDYKTGQAPSIESVQKGNSPQLILEAVMAYRGAFGPNLADKIIIQLYYWSLKGGLDNDKQIKIGKKIKDKSGQEVSIEANISQLMQDHWQALIRLIQRYNDPKQPYLSRPRPYLFDKSSSGGVPRFGDYVHLARVLEWSSMAEGE